MPLDEPWVIVVLTVVAVFAIRVLVIFILAGGDVNRIKQTIRASFRKDSSSFPTSVCSSSAKGVPFTPSPRSARTSAAPCGRKRFPIRRSP